MGNIINTLNIYKAFKDLLSAYFSACEVRPTVTKLRKMKRAIRAWEGSTSSAKRRDRRRRHLFNKIWLRRSKNAACRKQCEQQRKYNLFRKHVRRTLKRSTAKACAKNKCVPGLSRGRDFKHQAAIEQRQLRDLSDPLLRSYDIAVRDSPSTRCSKWVHSMPDASVWEKNHTLSGHNLSKLRKKRKHSKRLSEKPSQRSLLMKKLMQEKMSSIEKPACSRRHSKRQSSGNPRVSTGKKVFSRRNDTVISDDMPYETESECSSLTRKAKEAVTRVWSHNSLRESSECSASTLKPRSRSEHTHPSKSLGRVSNKSGKILGGPVRRKAVEAARDAHRKSLYQLSKLQTKKKKLKKIPVNTGKRHTCLEKMKLGEDEICGDAQTCQMLEKNIRHKLVQKKQASQMKRARRWLKEKSMGSRRSRVRFSKNMYTRKHRPGHYVNREKKKTSLGWAILQSIKLLERKGTAHTVAILRNVQTKWGIPELTLVQLREALKSMIKKGLLKSQYVRQKEVTCYTVCDCPAKRCQTQRKIRRSSLRRSVDSDLERGGKLMTKDGVPRVRFHHGPKNHTSIKCQQY